MILKPIEDNNTDFNLVYLDDVGKTGKQTPHCKIHKAMNKVSVFDDENKRGGYWRCLQAQCRAGCIEENAK